MTATSATPIVDVRVDDRHGEPTDTIRGSTDDLAHLQRPAYLGQKQQSRTSNAIVRASVPVALFLLWWLSTRNGWVSKSNLASPGQVWHAFREIQQNGQLKDFVLASASRAGWGITIGVIIGLVLGLAAGLTALAEGVVDPTMQMLRTIPFIALSPLFILWFGIDEKYKIVLIAYATSSKRREASGSAVGGSPRR
jgi:sulfonate transport system permease protein